MSRRIRTPEQRALAAEQARARRLRLRGGVPGPYDPVDPARAQQALCWAADRGVSIMMIVAESGVTASTLRSILRGERKRITLKTERYVLAGVRRAEARKRTGDLSPRRLDVDPYRTKLRRLAAAGWPVSEMLREEGLPQHLLRDCIKYITPEAAEAVDRLYERIDGRMGPSINSARTWRRKGYVVPAAEHPDDMVPLPPTSRALRQRWTG